MEIQLDCIPCMVRQALDTARLLTEDEKKQMEIVSHVFSTLANVDLNKSGPEVARSVYQAIESITGVDDPYYELKHTHIKGALNLYPALKEVVESAEDKICTALTISAIGNVIDAASFQEITIDSSLVQDCTKKMEIFHYEKFTELLKTSKTLLIIGDNSGETVFDRVLIEALDGIDVIYAVREKAIINDATEYEARESGLHKVSTIISSGCTTPGTVLSECTHEFLEIFDEADIVISKGQGNYESLCDTLTRPVFFLLKAKCPLVGKQLGVDMGDSVFVYLPDIH